MTTLERISQLESVESGFVTSSDSRWNRRKLIQFMNDARAKIISDLKGARIHPEWTQEFIPDYDELLQDSKCYTRFIVPSVIRITDKMDGFIFIGNTDGYTSYKRVVTRGELNNMRRHPILSRAITNGVAALYENGEMFLYSNSQVKSLRIEGIFNDPTSLPDFNINKDRYPIDDATFEIVKVYMKQAYMNQIASEPITSTRTSKNLQTGKR